MYAGIVQNTLLCHPLEAEKLRRLTFQISIQYVGWVLTLCRAWEAMWTVITAAVVVISSPFLSLTETFLGYTDAGASFVFGEKYTDHFFAFKVRPHPFSMQLLPLQ